MADVSDQSTHLSSLRGAPRLAFPCELVPYLLSTTEALVILGSSLFAAFSYHWATDIAVPNLLPYFAVGLIASCVHIVRLSGRNHYEFETASKPGVEMVEILVSWVMTALMLAFFAFILKIGVSFSRGSFLVFIGVAPVFLLGGRKAAKHFLIRAIANGQIGSRNIVLLGDAEEIAALDQKELLNYFGAADVNRFHLSREADPSAQQASDASILAKVTSFVRRNACSQVLVALPWNDAKRILFLREQIKLLPVSVKLMPDAHIRALAADTPSAGSRTPSLELQRAPLGLSERLVKRAMDILLALMALIAFLPIILISATAIKLTSRGPVIFRQKRKGFNGRNFVMLKMRTMKVMEDGASIRQASQNDPRITKIGRLLRTSSIDELPQLINVLRGDMSLVGPRPHALAHDSEFEKLLADYAFRHHVKPGMTGWAQVHGLRGATPTVEIIDKRVRFDLWYINNWSLWLDIQILLRTFFEVLRKRNAY